MVNCFNCKKEVDDESLCFGCKTYICAKCCVGDPMGFDHDPELHLEEGNCSDTGEYDL